MNRQLFPGTLQRWLDNLRTLLRYALIAVMALGMGCIVYFLLRHRVDLVLYIPIYCFIWVQAPATIILPLLYFYRKLERKPAWPYIRSEALWLLATFMTQVVLVILLRVVET